MAQKIQRRTVLRGLGAAIALPWLEAMGPALSTAAKAAEAAGTTQAAAPLRMAFFYVPNGVHMPEWTPKDLGTDFDLPAVLQPLARFKDDMLVLSGLAQHNAYALGDGGGDHARGLSCFLTGCHPLKTDGANIHVGTSVDQVAAQKVGHATRFPSLELGLEGGRQSGNCDSGYSCAYSNNISWRSPTTPVPKEVNPRLVFERLFASDIPGEIGRNRAERLMYRRSILDYVLDDAKGLQKQLAANDRRKVDEYLTSVRELEVRLARAERGESAGSGVVADGSAPPPGIPDNFQDHARLMADMLVLAFQGDVTRISTFVLANEGSNRSYNNLDISDGHHELSHHQGKAEKQEKIQKINTFHVEQFAYFIEKLKSIPEGDGTLLDHSMLLYGSGIGDGNRHNHNDLPIILLGKANGTIKTGRHVEYEKDTPLNNLFLSMLERMEAPVPALGDSTGRLGQLDG